MAKDKHSGKNSRPKNKIIRVKHSKGVSKKSLKIRDDKLRSKLDQSVNEMLLSEEQRKNEQQQKKQKEEQLMKEKRMRNKHINDELEKQLENMEKWGVS